MIFFLRTSWSINKDFFYNICLNDILIYKRGLFTIFFSRTFLSIKVEFFHFFLKELLIYKRGIFIPSFLKDILIYKLSFFLICFPSTLWSISVDFAQHFPQGPSDLYIWIFLTILFSRTLYNIFLKDLLKFLSPIFCCIICPCFLKDILIYQRGFLTIWSINLNLD